MVVYRIVQIEQLLYIDIQKGIYRGSDCWSVKSLLSCQKLLHYTENHGGRLYTQRHARSIFRCVSFDYI